MIDIHPISVFDAYTKTAVDIKAAETSHLLLQFQSSPILVAVLRALLGEVQVFLDAAAQVQTLRNPGNCTEASLDVLGTILNQPRTLKDGTVLADDQYESLLYAVVVKNRSRFCSIPEIQNFAKLVFGKSVGFTTTAPMDVNITIPPGAPTGMLDFFTRNWTDKRVDRKYDANYPATLRINALDDLCFTTDNAAKCIDIGKGEI